MLFFRKHILDILYLSGKETKDSKHLVSLIVSSRSHVQEHSTYSREINQRKDN